MRRIRRDATKESGAHYTPLELARFLARLTIETAIDAARDGRELVALDPACGDGGLIAALADAAQERGAPKLRLHGIDRDAVAVRATRDRLGAARIEARLERGDFLEDVARLEGRFDVVIANPPYVRTQVLGAAASQRLAARHGLGGRVDLYHAFVRAMTLALRDGGTLGLLCSNRFLSTRSGAAVREILASEYELVRVIDLGDTKVFRASVLPAIVIARKRRGGSSARCRFTRIYELRGGDARVASHVTKKFASPIAALESGARGVVRATAGEARTAKPSDGGPVAPHRPPKEVTFAVEDGRLAAPSASEPWRLTSPARERWLARVERHRARTFGDVARIRVGIKTTADAVFVRSDWAELAPDERPERALVHPLLTHHVAARWRASAPPARAVLYPYENRRAPIDLARFPRAARYLARHERELRARDYVARAGRAWFEIWVPQDPRDWARPKVVFPDISETPRFSLDRSGAIVNGDCYWLTLREGEDERWLALILAVANSSFALDYYDRLCSNRLYAGRRRFITQYVERFPLPALDSAPARAIVDAVARLVEHPDAALEAEIDRLVWRSFGFVSDRPAEAGRARK